MWVYLNERRGRKKLFKRGVSCVPCVPNANESSTFLTVDNREIDDIMIMLNINIKSFFRKVLSSIGLLDTSRFFLDHYRRLVPEFKKIKYTDQYICDEYDKIISYQPKKIVINKNYPLISAIEINKNCNLDCVMCKTSLSKRPDFNMSLDLFENILKKMKKLGLRDTTLHTIGEPLMNKDLFKYFELLRKYGIRIFLSTNAIPLNEKKIAKLLKWPDVIHTLRFSIDGATKDVFEKIRLNGKFNMLIRNLDTFKKMNKGIIKNIHINSIVSDDTKNQLAYHLFFYSNYVPMENIHLSLINGLSPDNSYFLSHSALKNHIVSQVPCSHINSNIMILNDGSASACCRDYNGDLVYGNIASQEVSELLDSKKLEELAEQHNNKKIVSKSLCASCYNVDDRVSGLFALFSKSLVAIYKNNWNVDLMQLKFNDFFTLFEKSIPSKNDFLRIIKPE